ncbi:hypothetical protein [Kribbella catacumbae]|uniref:hypothetical protein n=1 Tax=Kribbella catacumbae TaxID=460086 RepID=UPI00036F9487|nr:hypothetical protein [Kribbella catacumbae]
MTVYRRDDFAFPPARGRRGVEFRADGTFTDWLIGRGDAPEAHPGRWSATGQVSRGAKTGSGLPAGGAIVAVAADRLEIDWEE